MICTHVQVLNITITYEYTYVIVYHWTNEKSIRQWSGRLRFNPRLRHTKDTKNST